MKNDKTFKIMFFGTFILLGFLIVFFDWFRDRIDETVIVLFVIAFLPWLVNYIKSLEVFGVKTELVTPKERREIDDSSSKLNIEDKRIENINISIDSSQPAGSRNNPILVNSVDFLTYSYDNVEKTVLLRYKIEKHLKLLCEKNNIKCGNISIKQLVSILRDNGILNHSVCNLILDLLPILNKAVHCDLQNFNDYDLEWVINNGSKLLIYLDIIVQNPDAYWMISF